MKPTVFVTAELIFDDLLSLSDYFDFNIAGYGLTHQMLTHDEFKNQSKNSEVLITEFDTIDRDIIDNLPNLKAIICCRGGVRTVVDVDYAFSKGITVFNTAGRNKESSAVHTLALILDLLCNVCFTNSIVHTDVLSLHGTMPKEYKDSLWGLDSNSPYVKYRAPSIFETTVGIIGFGNAGNTLYSKLKLLGFKVVVYDHSPQGKNIVPDEYRDFDSLLSESDVVVLLASGNKDKMAIMNSREFNLMKKTSYFVNTSRGYLVDENAMIGALRKGAIAGAAIDVANSEPIQPGDPLLDCPNLIITPHIAGSSMETQHCGTRLAISYLKQLYNIR